MCRGPFVFIFIAVSASSAARASPEASSASSTSSAPLNREQRADSASAQPDADQLFAAAHQRYVTGDLHGAVTLLRQCFALCQDANLLFNIAQVYRELRDCAAATEYYERYVEYVPDGERVPDARRHIAELRSACPVEQPQVRSAEVRPNASAGALPRIETSRTNYWPLVAWVSFGTSALAAATTTYFAVESMSAKRDVERMLQQPPFDARALNTRLDDFYRDRNWTMGAAVATGVTAAVGVCALLAGAAGRSTPQQASFTVGARGNSIDLQWHF
jgi:tetratricopeptide (TPR) repeat protein